MSKHQISPPQYYRNSKTWKNLIGKQGKVIGFTTQYVQQSHAVAPKALQLAIVEFVDHTTRLLPVALTDQQISMRTKVICVLRKLSKDEENTVIEYGLTCRTI